MTAEQRKAAYSEDYGDLLAPLTAGKEEKGDDGFLK